MKFFFSWTKWKHIGYFSVLYYLLFIKFNIKNTKTTLFYANISVVKQVPYTENTVILPVN